MFSGQYIQVEINNQILRKIISYQTFISIIHCYSLKFRQPAPGLICKIDDPFGIIFHTRISILLKRFKLCKLYQSL